MEAAKLQALADELFDAIDTSGDGKISHVELARALRTNDRLRRELGFPTEREASIRAHALGTRGAELRAITYEELWAEMDTNGDITIDRSEFTTWIQEHHKKNGTTSEAELHQTFSEHGAEESQATAPSSPLDAQPSPPVRETTPLCSFLGLWLPSC